jgi:hypothetical protein
VQRSIPRTPEQNGVSERMNRTLMDSARSMMHHASLPQTLWAEAVATATYLRNRTVSTTINGVTPFEVWNGSKPDVSTLRVFGCCAYVHVPKEQRSKLDAKARQVIFVGYPNGIKGYKFYDPESKRIFSSRDVQFAEREFYHEHGSVGQRQAREAVVNLQLEDPLEEVQAQENHEPGGAANDPIVVAEPEPIEQQMAVDPPAPAAVAPTYEHTYDNAVRQLPARRARQQTDHYQAGIAECFRVEDLTAEIDEPANIRDAWSCEYGVQWKEATDSEFDSLRKANTWDLVPLPKGKNIVGSRCVFKVKRNADNTIDRFKARLVAQGFSQVQGFDFDEVFSPVARYTAIRTVFAIAATLDLELHQMDVKTAFLNGQLDNEIYMRQPEHYVDEQGARRETSRGRFVAPLRGRPDRLQLLPRSGPWAPGFRRAKQLQSPWGRRIEPTLGRMHPPTGQTQRLPLRTDSGWVFEQRAWETGLLRSPVAHGWGY